MEAYPPGSDQLLSWESHTLRSTPSASRGYTTQQSEKRRGGVEGRVHFDITFGSSVIQCEFSYPFACIVWQLCLRGCRLYSCVIFYHKGEFNNTNSLSLLKGEE